MSLITILTIDNFQLVRDVRPTIVSQAALDATRELHESEEIEPWIQAILHDTNHTPHGPSEIVDILTHKMSVRTREGLGAFILKGRSYPTVRPRDISHQIFRLERIADLSFVLLVATGNVLDEVKEQFVSTAKRLNCKYGFLDCLDLARVLIAYGYLCPHDGEKIYGGKCHCGYTPAVRTSNILQQETLKELSITHKLGQRSGVIILPTGAGKTRVAAIDVYRQDPKLCLYVAHSHEILEDAESELLLEFPPDMVKRFDSRPQVNELRKINLITIQSLVRNLDLFKGRKVNYLIIDEFHHAAAKSYRTVVSTLNPDFLLGLTATPFRCDRQDVLELCDGNAIVSFELREGIELGILCPYHYYGCFDDVDYSNIRHNGIRYDIRDLETALIIPERDTAIIRKWREKADGLPSLAFCCSQEHARRVAKSFRNEGIEAQEYISATPANLRAELRQSFESRKLKILCVIDILNEGVDLPFAECLLFLRPTESKRVFMQQLGRGLRQSVGKRKCIVIDFIGNFKNAYRIVEYHGLDPFEDITHGANLSSTHIVKAILNLPQGCIVEFDEAVINIFGNQTLDPRYATRHNIGRILIYQYRKLEHRLGRKPTRIELDRQCLLGSDLYASVFGSWSRFEKQIQ
ncbi:MAG: DEAD/DEAH box helicase family protein [Promethearchaeota archaeon]